MSNESDRESEGGLNPRPKREPPVIDADAKDVTPSSQESAAKPVSDAGPMLKNAKNIEWRTTLPAIGVAALCGVAAGLFGAWLFSSSAPQSADASAINNSIAQLSSRLTQQETKTQPAPDLTPLSERSAKLETATGELRGELAEVKKLVAAQANAPAAAELNAVNRRLAQIEEKVGALAAAPKAEPKNETQPAEIVALGALRDAVAAGTPFANELAAVRGILKDRAAALASLDKFAKEGLPTTAALAKRFEPLAAKLASPPAQEDSGVFTRLWNNAGKLVEMRPVGEPQGSDPGAVVARMETKLSRGDLSGALEESKALPAQAREIAKDWFAAAEQRRDADAAIRNLINAALAAISAERPKQ
ncbi:MAG: hypothetical protein K2P86_10335 [Xanthobacteraceae bacterium]|nr:hypothetical protein [Xanthobacteraceae bacterium]